MKTKLRYNRTGIFRPFARVTKSAPKPLIGVTLEGPSPRATQLHLVLPNPHHSGENLVREALHKGLPTQDQPHLVPATLVGDPHHYVGPARPEDSATALALPQELFVEERDFVFVRLQHRHFQSAVLSHPLLAQNVHTRH